MAQNWVATPGTNYGVLLKFTPETAQVHKQFYSRESTTVSKRPKLDITYTTPSNSSTTFTQTLPMASNFVMPAGGLITVTNYISTTGTLTANPAITATLKSNGTTFSTLTNPTATLVSAGTTTSNVAYKVGSFTKSTSTGNQVITHNLGKTPKALILWTAGQTSDGTAAGNFHVAQGFSDGTTSYSFSAASQNNVSTSNNSRRFAAKAISIVEWGESLKAEANLSSWTTSSFTLNWTTNNTDAYIIHYMIIGGADVSAKVVNWQMPTSTGIKSVTGVGFKPDLVLHGYASDNVTAAAPTSVQHLSFGFGGMNSAGQQWVSAIAGNDALSTSVTARMQRTDAMLAAFASSGTTTRALASYSSMNADGFSVNFSSATSAGQVASLALRGIDSKLGSFNKRTSVGSQSITGVGFQPDAVMFALYGSSSSTAAKDDARFGIGASDGTTEASMFVGDQHDQTTTVTAGIDSTTKAIVKTEGASLRAAADLSSMDSGGFTLNWTTEIESFAAEVLYLALDAPQTTTPSVYKVIWNGVMASNTTAATGQAVNLTVASGVTQPVQVLYDSSTYPSRIALPTNTVINVDSLAFYDAPYPNGNVVTSGAPGQTLYIRTQVSDPFGFADIVTTTLSINGSPIVLGPANVVAAADALKTYEYAWLTPVASSAACNDTYNISVVADEGYETGAAAINAKASTKITISCNDSGNPCAANFLSGLGGSIVTQYSAGSTVFMQVVDYDHRGGGTLSVDLSGTAYTLNETGPNTGIFQGSDSTIAGGSTRTLTYSDATAAPAGSDVCIVDIAAPDVANPGITVRKTRIIPSGGLALVGGQVVYEIAVTNSGNQSLSTVQVVDTYDAAYLHFQTAEPAQSAQSAASTGIITWANVGPLASGQSKVLEVSFTALGTISPTINSVVATGTPSGGGGNVTDSDSAQVVIAGPEVDLTKTTIIPAAHQPVFVGSLVTFQIDIHNVGDLGIDILPMIDYFDTYCLAYVSSPTPPDGVGFGGMLFWNDLTQTFGNNLAIGDHFYVDVTFRLLQVCSPAVNNASVQGAVAEIPPGSGQVTGAGLPVVYDDDYVIGAASYDFGDAPDSYGTTLAANGPQHVISLFQPLALGSALPDHEADGQPGPSANGDDLTGTTPDDEDAFSALPDLIPGGSSYSLTVPLTNTTGTTATLYAWVDFNADGLFSATEIATVTVPYAASSAVLNWSGVAITSTPSLTMTYARLRLTSDLLTDVGATAVDERALGPASNGEVEDYMAPFPKHGAIGDYIWYDTNGNGVQDVGEPGLGNVTVTLRDSNGVVVQTTTTDANGGYLFNNLPADTYTVDVTDVNGILTGYTLSSGPQSATDPTAPIVLGPAEIFRDADFGYRQPTTPGTAVIGDTVWWDNNQNGVRDPGELGIPGITVELKDPSGTVISTTVTNENGNYLFSNVTPGAYFVDAVNPPGDPDPAAPDPTALFTVSANQQYLDADIGRVPVAPATIGGTVWNDTTPNGLLSGEPGLPGVTVDLLDTSGKIIATTTTDSNGTYTFTVPAGSYGVQVSDTHDLLDDFTDAPLGPNQGTDNNNQAQPYAVTVAAGQTNTTADFGYVSNGTPGQTGIIGNQVWVETDLDGLYEPLNGEIGVAGVTVDLLDAGGTVLFTTTTGADGGYVFSSLPAGTYQVRVSDTQGVLASYSPTLIVGGTADNTNKDQPYSVVLTDGEIDTSADFGYMRFGSIGDFVWYDTNGDGVQDGGEPGIPGVVISLTNSIGQIITTTTDANGIYSFTVLADTYTVTVASGTPSGANPTSGPQSQTSPYPVTLSAGQSITDADFGYRITPAYALSKDLLTDSPARTGSLVQFRITITNTGDGVIDFLPLVDTYDELVLRYVTASTAPEDSISDGTLNWADLTTTLGDLLPGQVISLTVSFEGLKDTGTLPGGNTENVAAINGATVDPDGAGPLGSVETLPPVADSATVVLINPTNVIVINGSVRPLTQTDPAQVEVSWETVSELEIAGFHVYRLAPGEAAVRLTEQPMLSSKAGQAEGDVYKFVDNHAVVGVNYAYELELLPSNSQSARYQLGTVVWQHDIFLPLVVR